MTERISKHKKPHSEDLEDPEETESNKKKIFVELEDSNKETDIHNCGVCNEEFTNIEDLNNHSKMEHYVIYLTGDTESEYQMSEAGELESIEEEPIEYVESDNQDEINLCTICHTSFSTELALNNHMKVQHASECVDFTMDTEENQDYVTVELPVEFENIEGDVCCRICLKKFTTTMALNNHAKIEHIDVFATGDANAWTCPISELNVKYQKSRDKPTKIKQEDRTYLSKEDVLSAMAPDSLVSLVCDTVDYIIMKDTDDKSGPLNEKTKKPRPKPRPYANVGRSPEDMTCEQCGRKFDVRDKLIRHIRYAHNRKDIVCDVCGKSMPSATHLKYHKRLHTGEKPYLCTACPSAFINITKLKGHYMKNHIDHQDNSQQPKKPFLCTNCPRSFTTSTQLKNHFFSHHVEKPYHCEVCQKRFSSKALLIDHESMHITEKPYACELCPQKFNQQQSLILHNNACHSGQKQNYCEACDETFASLNALRIHVTTNHSEKMTYNCEQCPKKYSKESALKTHVLANHGNSTRYVCKICDKTFGHLHSLKLHKQRVHRSDDEKVIVETNVEQSADDSTHSTHATHA